MAALFVKWLFSSGWKYLAGAFALALIVGSYVYVGTHYGNEGYARGVTDQKIETDRVQLAYGNYANQIAGDAARANAKALKDRSDQDATIAGLRASLAASQAKASAASSALTKALQGASKGDTSPISKAIANYLAAVASGQRGDGP